MQRNRKVWYVQNLKKKGNRDFSENAQVMHIEDKNFKAALRSIFKEIQITMINELKKA